TTFHISCPTAGGVKGQASRTWNAELQWLLKAKPSKAVADVPLLPVCLSALQRHLGFVLVVPRVAMEISYKLCKSDTLKDLYSLMQQPAAGYIKPAENPSVFSSLVFQTAGTSSGSRRRAPQVSQIPAYLGRRLISV
ncbi:hypothetical protein EK904_001800, partial [Melospiza melodia maxima]